MIVCSSETLYKIFILYLLCGNYKEKKHQYMNWTKGKLCNMNLCIEKQPVILLDYHHIP